ncbi:MAG: DegT/DnrJ/EryC1/StrS family aminotransferase [Eubacterium sp.]|nr:DegT/DnrJ/EryC1/StrS family aminotransferase [Eubacterium sp.]
MSSDINDKRNISFSPPDITDEECEEVVKALKSGWITTGPRTKELEKKLAGYIGVEKTVCLSSATAAEELNLRVLGIGPGDEVIVPAYTYTATASAAVHVGATIRFADSEKDGPLMDMDSVASLINEKTKAVVAVDLGGVIPDYRKLFDVVSEKKSLFVPALTADRDSEKNPIEKLTESVSESIGRVAVLSDSAHALGASRFIKNDGSAEPDRKMAGAIADFTSFSFHAVKNFTTAEGGAAAWRDIPGIDNDDIYKVYQLLSLHGQSKDALAKTKLGAWEYDILGPYYKSNMTDVAAAMGLVQFKRYPEMLKRRKAIIGRYDEMCERLGIDHLVHFTDEYESSGHLYLTFIPWADDMLRREIITRMAERGIACNVHYKPLPMMTAYRKLGFDIKDYPNAYNHYEKEITLPLHTRLTDEDVDYIIYHFGNIIEECRK